MSESGALDGGPADPDRRPQPAGPGRRPDLPGLRPDGPPDPGGQPRRRGPGAARHPDPRRRRSPTGWPPRWPRSRASTIPAGALDITMYRDDLRRQPTRAVGRTQVPSEHRRRRRGAGRRRALLRAGRSGRRWTPSAISVGRGPSGWPCWSTAGTGSCRSAPTTSARTCRPRPASGSASGWSEVDGVNEVTHLPAGGNVARPGTDDLDEEESGLMRHLLSAGDLEPGRDHRDPGPGRGDVGRSRTVRSRSCPRCAVGRWSTCSSRTPPGPGPRSSSPASGCRPT